MSSVSNEYIEQVEPLEHNSDVVEEGTMVRHIFDEESCGTVIKRESHTVSVLWSKKPASLRYDNVTRIKHILKKYADTPIIDSSMIITGSTALVSASLRMPTSLEYIRIDFDLKV
jgi:hypothetical protein